MAHIDDFTLATDTTFLNRLRAALCNTANSVASEGSTAHSAVDQKRHAMAAAILVDGGATKLNAFAFSATAAGTLGTVAAPPTDATIDSRLSAIFNNLAGVSAQDSINP